MNAIDYVRAKVWSSNNPGKVATASSFTIVQKKVRAKSIEHSIMKTFPEQSSLPWNKICYVPYLVTYFMTAMIYVSVQFRRSII